MNDLEASIAVDNEIGKQYQKTIDACNTYRRWIPGGQTKCVFEQYKLAQMVGIDFEHLCKIIDRK